MRFYADASVRSPLVRALRALGADVIYRLEVDSGASDETVLAAPVAEDRVLIAEDTDFGALVFVDRLPAIGIVLLRVNLADAAATERTASRITALSSFGRGAFTTLDEEAARTRSLPS